MNFVFHVLCGYCHAIVAYARASLSSPYVPSAADCSRLRRPDNQVRTGTIKVPQVHEDRLNAGDSAATCKPSAHRVETTTLNTEKANAIEFLSIQGFSSIFGRADLTHPNSVSALVFYAL